MSTSESQHDHGSDEPPSMPWDRRPSILEFVRSHISADQHGLTEGGDTLPDDERVNVGSSIRWAAGAIDGVFTHHMGGGRDEEIINKAVNLVLAFSNEPTVAKKAAVYQHILDENTLSIIDPLIEALVAESGINHQRLYELAESFTLESSDREPVKFGIAILGLFREAANEELFQTLGRHEEFTLYCAVALGNLPEQSEEALWTLARNVDGWGRIHVVERLAQTKSPEIKNWLLRGGYRNSVMYEYLAGTCAKAGGLIAALSEDHVDRELLTSAGEILEALIAGGPADSVDDYEDGAVAIEMYLTHVDESAEILDDFLHVNSIKSFLETSDFETDARRELGWTAPLREELTGLCVSILSRPEWPNLVRSALNSSDEFKFSQADQAATALGIDTWDLHWQRLRERPTDSGCWYHVMTRCNDERIDLVVEAAERWIDLTRIATGAGNEMGLGPGYEQHSCVCFIVQELRRFPGSGGALIEASLKSPVVRNRNMAIAALASWRPEHKTNSVFESLRTAAIVEPDEGVRDRMQKVLDGESLEE